jgi:O-antigen/teichoic acid export membrane protein
MSAPDESAADRGNAHLNAPQPGRGTIQILVAQVFVLASGFGVALILARGLGPVEFGIYGVVVSILAWLERIISAGVPRATATLLPRMPEQRAVIEQSARVLLVSISLPLFLLAWFAAPLLSDYLGIPSGTLLIRIAAINLPMLAAYSAYDGIFSGLRMFAAQSVLQIVQSMAKLAGIVVLLLVGLSVKGAFVANVAASIATLLVIALRFPLGGERASTAIMREMIRLSLPMASYLLALTILMSLSLWQLQSDPGHDPRIVGVFVAALNLVRIMMMVPSSVSVVLYPSLLWAISSERPDLATNYVQGAVRFALVVTVPACVLLAVNASAVMDLLFGAQYESGGTILAVLCVTFALIALFDVLFNTLMAYGRLVLTAAVLIGLIPVLYVLNSLWIPAGGGVGAAIASLVTIGCGAAIAIGLTYRQLGAPIRLLPLLRIGGAGLAIGLLSAGIESTGFWLVVELGGLSALYLTLLWITREISAQDLRPFAIWTKSRQ